MKRLICLFLAIGALGILCFLSSREKDGRFQTAFPLDAEVIVARMEKVGLPGVISESETYSYAKGHIAYTVRSPSETYDGAENNRLVASIGSATYKGERALLTVFDQSVASKQIVWEDWKQQIVLAALLYGGFGDEEDVYKALIEMEFPDNQTSFSWDAQLSGGYCRVSYVPRSHTFHDEDGFAVQQQSDLLRVNIYESCALYERLRYR